MKSFITILFLFLIINSCNAQKAEKELVKQSFELYKTAILNDKGDEAVKYVDSRTIKYYADILNYVKTADSAKVNSLTLIDKIMIFSIRHRTPKQDILSFDGKGLLIYAIKSGMVGKNSVSNNTTGEVTIDKNFAKGQFVFNGQATPYHFHFYKEDGIWKTDLTSIFPISTMAFKKIIEDSGQNENDYLFELLEMTTGRFPEETIWNPIQ